MGAKHQGSSAPGSLGYLWRDRVFTGDTLMINSCGRTDFQQVGTVELPMRFSAG